MNTLETSVAPPQMGGAIPTPPLQKPKRRTLSPSLEFTAKEITFDVAKKVVEAYHYSRCMPKGKSMHFGAFIGEELEPYAVATYGIGVSMVADTYLTKATGIKISRSSLFELKAPS